ncbi:MAG: hypothetical protein WDW36_000218 [Sanguina aurantia]
MGSQLSTGHAPTLTKSGPKLSLGSNVEHLIFLLQQSVHEQLHAFHVTNNTAFPRPCPLCRSHQFMVTDAATGVTSFGSRPQECDQCQRWTHLSCLGVQCVEDVPQQPWFHCPQCRKVHLRLEAEALRGIQAVPFSPGHHYALVTDSEHRAFVDRRPMSEPGRIVMPLVYNLLGQNFHENVVAGYGQRDTEYAGGKYAMLLWHNRAPVSALTFNVFGSGGAQINLIVTAEAARRQGHCSTLLETWAAVMSSLGVVNVITQPQNDSLDIWVEKFGFEVIDPMQAASMHKEVPVAFYDSPVLYRAIAPQAGAV